MPYWYDLGDHAIGDCLECAGNSSNVGLIIRYFGASVIALCLLKLMRDPLPFDTPQ